MPDEIEREFKQEALDAAIRIAKRDAKDIQKEPKIFDGFLGLGKGKNTFFDINKLSNDRGLNLSTEEIAKIINNSYQELELPNKFDISILPKKYRKQMQDGGELVGGQKKLDLDKDGDLDEEDFKMLREGKQEGGLLSDDRKKYVLGTLASKVGSKASKLFKKSDKEIVGLENILLDKKYSQLGAPTFTKKELNKIKTDSDLDSYKDYLREFVSVKQNDYNYIEIAKSYGMTNKEISELLKKSDKEIRATLERIGMRRAEEEAEDLGISAAEKAIEEAYRNKKQEGGTAIDNQMANMMPEEKTEEQKAIENAQVPDEMMEENYVDFLIDEALDDEEEEMLMEELQANPKLSMLFDKVMEVAMEFSGSGPVEGPGSEVSDSIPARLSDGEFVFTAKSVKEIGADNLMAMMKQAEAQADQRQMAQEGGLMEEEETAMPVQQEPVRQDIRVTKETVGSQASVQEEDDLVGDELKKQMLSGRPHVRS